MLRKSVPVFTAFAIVAASTTIAAPSAAAQSAAKGQWTIDNSGNLSAMLDCFEREEKTLISAHRGGPTPGLPENSIEAMDAMLYATPAIMEIDVARSRDGVPFLLHDNTLDRTTNGSGEAAALDWSDLQQLRLRDADGWTTPYGIPTLKSALDWAKDRTVLQIDFKRSAKYEDVIELIRSTGNRHNVILIAYSLSAATKLHQLAPEMMISLSIDRPGALDEAIAAGIAADRLLAFTGTRSAKPGLYAFLERADVEVIFGTLGGPNSIDRKLDRLGNDARYAELGEAGVDIIATDRARAAAKALASENRLPAEGTCGVGRRSR